MPIIKSNMTKKCKNFCEKNYVDIYFKSKLTNKNKMKQLSKNQIDKSKKMISSLCKINYCNKGCIGMNHKYTNNICNSKNCKKTYKTVKKYPIDTFCSDDDMWNKK